MMRTLNAVLLIFGTFVSYLPHVVISSKGTGGSKILKHPYSNLFSKTPALATFNAWAIEATKNGGSVSFSEGII
jgi:hypothetical protein